MKIAILVEGETEKAFMPMLRSFLSSRLPQMPKLVPIPYLFVIAIEFLN